MMNKDYQKNLLIFLPGKCFGMGVLFLLLPYIQTKSIYLTTQMKKKQYE